MNTESSNMSANLKGHGCALRSVLPKVKSNCHPLIAPSRSPRSTTERILPDHSGVIRGGMPPLVDGAIRPTRSRDDPDAAMFELAADQYGASQLFLQVK